MQYIKGFRRKMRKQLDEEKSEKLHCLFFLNIFINNKNINKLRSDKYDRNINRSPNR